jgi:hypothetical protein
MGSSLLQNHTLDKLAASSHLLEADVKQPAFFYFSRLAVKKYFIKS